MKPVRHVGAVFILMVPVVLLVMMLCVCMGSVTIPADEIVSAIADMLYGRTHSSVYSTILFDIRLPRVICAGACGAALSVSGAAMQGLLRNPLADGSTVGSSGGASLGAVLSIALGIHLPLPFPTSMVFASLSAMVSLVLILGLTYRLDSTLSTNTIILLGVIYTMFISGIISLIVTLYSTKVKEIAFWTMGSLSGSGYNEAIVLIVVLIVFGGALIFLSDELNAFAISDENAHNIGVDTGKVRMAVLVCVSVLIGVSVSVGGTIGFVGLVVPHMLRMLTGPDHKRLLPACVFGGAVFLMLTDLAARTLARPLELPIGIITSFVGSILFVYIFCRRRQR